MTPSPRNFSSSSLSEFWPRRAMPRVPIRSVSYRHQKRSADPVKRNRSILPPMGGLVVAIIFIALAAASIGLASA